ncbi:MAG TPA: hypothetical protein VGR62_21620 [Candidatus Binatia bacterium]|jgi:WD40 repeat protein|nr:hypothetical protein [Candidatus Binatia bacterium]
MRLTALLLLVASACTSPPQTGSGEVTAVVTGRITVQRDDVAGKTLTMAVDDPALLDGIAPPTRIVFTYTRRGGDAVLLAITSRDAAPAVHDHAPRHGGLVAMVGRQHLEALATADGRVRVWLTDFFRRPLPLDGVTGTVRVASTTVPLTARDGALEAVLPTPADAQIATRIDVAGLGADFILPITEGAAGAAGVVGRCAPPERTGPACTMRFSGPVTGLAASPDGTTLLVAVPGVAVSRWRLPDGDLLGELASPPPVPLPPGETPHGDVVDHLAWRADGRALIVAHENRLVRYAMPEGTVTTVLPALPELIRDVAWTRDGRILVATTFNRPFAFLLDVDGVQPMRMVPLDGEGAAVAIAPDGALAAVGTASGHVVLVDLRDATVRDTLQATDALPVHGLAFVDGRLAAASADGILRIWTFDPPALERTVRTMSPLNRLRTDGLRLAGAGAVDGAIALVDLVHDDGALTTLAWHPAQVIALTWAGSRLISGDVAGNVAVWPPQGGQVPAGARVAE